MSRGREEPTIGCAQHPQVQPTATGARNYSQCDSMLIGDTAAANTYPYISVRCSRAVMLSVCASKSAYSRGYSEAIFVEDISWLTPVRKCVQNPDCLCRCPSVVIAAIGCLATRQLGYFAIICLQKQILTTGCP